VMERMAEAPDLSAKPRPERAERPARFERSERPERGDRPERAERPAAPRREKPTYQPKPSRFVEDDAGARPSFDPAKKPYAKRDSDEGYGARAPKPYAPRTEGDAAKKPRWSPDDRAERGDKPAP